MNFKTLPLIGALVFSLSMTDASAAPANPQVLIKTSKGDIVVELYPTQAPITVDNFLKYVDAKHYDGTIFHRVIGNFMIQGGGFTADMKQKPTREGIKLESKNGLKNDRGTIAMARTAIPDSGTAQFFINVVDNAMLNHPQPDGHGYAVFGKVVKGLETVDTIKAVRTGRSGMHSDVPVEAVVIESITRISH
jgi:peptidyl-prolyl cis-trans isomerase A (cyclophilin A)